MDYGKHNYTILYGKGKKGLRLTLRPLDYYDADKYNALVEKVADSQADLNDVMEFQKLLDDRARYLLALSPEDIFHVEEVNITEQPFKMADLYVSCFKCGQQVSKSRIVAHQGKNFCMPCFNSMNAGRFYYNLQ